MKRLIAHLTALLLALLIPASGQAQKNVLHAAGAIKSDLATVRSEPHLIISLGGLSEADLPERLELRQYLPPVGDQGSQGSCVGWATAYYAWSYSVGQRSHAAPMLVKSPAYPFSPAFVYNSRQAPNQSGMSFTNAMSILSRGCVRLKDFKYKDTMEAPVPPALKEEARMYSPLTPQGVSGGTLPIWVRGEQPGTEADFARVRAFLAVTQMPLVFNAYIMPSFHKARGSAIYEGPTSDEVKRFVNEPEFRTKFCGMHAMTLVGYDRDKKAFLLVNSWGERWGDKGFLWVGEKFLRVFCGEIWAVRAGGPMALGGGDSMNWRSKINKRGDIEIQLQRPVIK